MKVSLKLLALVVSCLFVGQTFGIPVVNESKVAVEIRDETGKILNVPASSTANLAFDKNALQFWAQPTHFDNYALQHVSQNTKNELVLIIGSDLTVRHTTKE